MAGRVQRFEIKLEQAIYYYIKEKLVRKDWEIVAIDRHKNIVALRRYDTGEEEQDPPNMHEHIVPGAEEVK